MPPRQAMIRTETLGKSYGPRSRPVHALREVTLEIPAGVTAVVGPNGAGKTTLLGLILGFLKPTSGRVLIDDQRPRDYLRTHGAGYLPERFRLPGPWPAREALRTLAQLEGVDAAEADRRTEGALERLGLTEHAAKPVAALSRGLQQRLGLAQALVGERELVVLDEPTEGLDPLWRVRFRDVVSDLRGQGRSVILASHELTEVERLADRAILLADGELREVLDLGRPTGGPARYRLETTGSPAALSAAFPEARPAPGASPPTERAGATTESAVIVEVPDPAELSHRLAAFLAEGGLVRAVVPLEQGLEDRVRQRLEEP